jgi:glucokinase
VDLTIGVDVGGTKIAAAVVDPAGNVVDSVRIPTPVESAGAVEDGIVDAMSALAGRHEVIAAGVAVPGFVDEKRSTLRFAPNLPIRDRPLRDLLMERLRLPIVIENDANAAAWGESKFGGGRGASDMVLVTVGTGIGGGIVLNNTLIRGSFGAAAEIGHMRVVPDGELCGCGRSGCWEQYASGSALGRYGRELAEAEPDVAVELVRMAGGDHKAIEGWMVGERARAGDPAGLRLMTKLGNWLGAGIADLADILDPAVVVVGGGVVELGDLLLVPARQAYEAQLSAAEHRPHLRIVGAQLGNDAGMIGAADLARTA